MPTTSSPTSSRPSTESRPLGPLVGWLALAAIQIALSFASRSNGTTEKNALFDWTVAASGLVAYAILLVLTIAVAQGYGRPREAVGLRAFERRWLGYAFA